MMMLTLVDLDVKFLATMTMSLILTPYIIIVIHDFLYCYYLFLKINFFVMTNCIKKMSIIGSPKTPVSDRGYLGKTLDAPAFKTINDPIHGHIRLDKDIMSFIDTPQFQRLRDLKQLGSCYFVYPGASHNRFEHCIGVCHLAGEWIDMFASQQKELMIDEREQKLVRLAGLCHDLGHGPFSHVFDNEFIPRAQKGIDKAQRWCHEDGSLMMLDYLIDDNNIDIEKEDVQFIKDLIKGEEFSDRRFLNQIVANHKNSIDVDKFDYLQRDSVNLGYKSSYDAARLMKFSKVLDDEICFSSKEVYNLYEMFHTRYSLHKQVYTHRVGKAVEYMITDALLEANPVYKISDMIYDREQYVHLTDCILRTIESSREPELQTSRNIIKRLRTRQLYKFVDEILLQPEQLGQVKITEEDVASCSPNGTLRPDDLIIHNLTINYAMKDKNPVDNVRFYRQGNPNPFFIKKEQVSLLIPDRFQESAVRLYVRDEKNAIEAYEAFQKNLKRLKVETLGTPSPFKKTPK
jgi:HD superfamily phosphohydrolase